MIIKSRQELEKQVDFYNFLKERNSSVEGHYSLIEVDNISLISDAAFKILNECGKVILKLNTCNGLSQEILEKLAINKEIIYQFTDELNEISYTFDDLCKIYDVLETFKCITDNAENNIHKIVMVCNIITWLVWYNQKGDKNNEYATKEDIIISRSLRGSFFEGKAVCLGFALTLKVILNYLGIETTLVGGYGENEHHAWNQVKDDIYYNLDLTFDWQAFLMDLEFANTLKSDEDFYKNHSTSVSWEDYSNLKRCPKSISNNEIRYYSKTIPESLRVFLKDNQSKGLNKLLEYRQYVLDNDIPTIYK